MVYKYIARTINSQRGFSFIELMICIAVIIISFSILQVSFKTSDDISLQYEAVYLVNILRNMQERNRQAGAEKIFYPNAGNTISRLVILDSHEYRISSMGEVVSHRLPDSIFIYSNQKSVFFSRDNTSTGVTLRLDKGKSRIKVIIDTVGRIRIMR